MTFERGRLLSTEQRLHFIQTHKYLLANMNPTLNSSIYKFLTSEKKDNLIEKET